jgi:hypothetical protein
MKSSTYLGCAAALALLAPLTAGAGGTVVAVDGKAAVQRGAEHVPVVVALPVNTGDTVTVKEQSKVQLQFDDDSMFSIPGAAVLRVDAFESPKNGPGRAVYTLVEGGLRTITGRVSKNPQDVYALNTDIATITVRGSAYTALRCRTKCNGSRTGLYVRAEKGLITVGNDGGKLSLRPGEVAFVEGKATAPLRVGSSPFNDPVFAAGFAFDDRIDTGRDPPRIEGETPVSPS